MRHTPFLLIVSLALAGCSRQTPPETSANVAGTSAAPAVPATPAASTNDVAGPAAATAAANGLWGVAEEEDAASHRGIDFVAFNRTGRTITALAIRPDEGEPGVGTPQDPWSANVLTQRELPDGTRAAAHFEADIELCRWQLRATFADRQTRAWPAVNLCDTIRVDLR